MAEHHANMLPWRRHDLRLLPLTGSAGELLDRCERALRAARFDLVAVTGASNVTGAVWPLAELAALAHRHGAELLVDAAQLAPHRPIDIASIGIDYLALSAHNAIGVRHGCFCAHPLITRLLGVPDREAAHYHAQLRAGHKPLLPEPSAQASGSTTPPTTSTGPCTPSNASR